MPGEPEANRDAVGRRRDASTKTADDVWRGQQEQTAERDAVPSAREALAPEPDARGHHEHPGESQDARRAGQRPQHGSKERGGGEEWLHTKRWTDRRANRQPDHRGEDRDSFDQADREREGADEGSEQEPRDHSRASLIGQLAGPPCSAGTGSTLKSSRRPAVVGSS